MEKKLNDLFEFLGLSYYEHAGGVYSFGNLKSPISRKEFDELREDIRLIMNYLKVEIDDKKRLVKKQIKKND